MCTNTSQCPCTPGRDASSHLHAVPHCEPAKILDITCFFVCAGMFLRMHWFAWCKSSTHTGLVPSTHVAKGGEFAQLRTADAL